MAGSIFSYLALTLVTSTSLQFSLYFPVAFFPCNLTACRHFKCGKKEKEKNQIVEIINAEKGNVRLS
jgi:hypothetical protein